METWIEKLRTDDIMEQAAKLYGAYAADFRSLGDFENYIYEFRKDGKKFVLRMTHSSHRTRDEVQGELEWVNYLAENGMNVTIPCKSVNGNLVEGVDASDGSGFSLVAFEKIEGTLARDMEITNNIIEEWGRTTGRMHTLTKSFEPSEERYRRSHWFQDDLFVNYMMYIPENQIEILSIIKNQIEKLKMIPVTPDSYGLIHGDIHLWNFFVQDGKITVCDFDDAEYNYFASDIAIPLFYSLWNPKIKDKPGFTENFMEHFLRGYARENLLEPSWADYMHALLKLRRIALYIVAHKKSSEHERETEKMWQWVNAFGTAILQDAPVVECDFSAFI